MPSVKLTAKGIEALTTDRAQEDFSDTLVPGLLLRVSGTTGSRVWYVRYRINGTRRRYKLGPFPRVSLAKARKKAREALEAADAGEDPAQERQERRAEDRTFGALAEEVLEARALRTREATQAERARLLEKELLPSWGDRDADGITRREVVHLVEGIARRGAPVVANRTLALVRLIFNDGLRRGFPGIEANPAHLVEAPGEETGRDRYLSASEVVAVWKATEGETPTTRGAFRLAILTAQRIGSVCKLRWDGISGDLWTIPEAHNKGGRAHLCPLSPEALAVLEELRAVAGSDEWVFPSREGARKPYVTNLAGSLARVRKEAGIPHWTAHDLRTTLRTHATRAQEDGGLGVAPNVADAILGHAERSLGWSRYQGDRHLYLLHEKREALRAWGGFVRKAVEASK